MLGLVTVIGKTAFGCDMKAIEAPGQVAFAEQLTQVLAIQGKRDHSVHSLLPMNVFVRFTKLGRSFAKLVREMRKTTSAIIAARKAHDADSQSLEHDDLLAKMMHATDEHGKPIDTPISELNDEVFLFLVRPCTLPGLPRRRRRRHLCASPHHTTDPTTPVPRYSLVGMRQPASR